MTAAVLKQRMLAADNAPVAVTKASAQTIVIPKGRGEPEKTVELKDDYAWLRGEKWPKETVDDADIIDYLTQENDYCKEFLKSLEEHQTKFFETLKGRIKLTDKTVESKKKSFTGEDWYYYSRTEEALQYSIDCRRQGKDGAEEILLDRNKLAEGKKFCKVLGSSVSGNGNLMAYRSDFVGDENYKLTFQKLNGPGSDKETFLPESEEIEQVSTYCYHEAPNTEDDPIGIFYVVRNEQLRPTKVFYHKFGANVADDQLIFESKNDMFTVGVGCSSDRKYVMVSYHSKTEDEIRSISVTDSLEMAKNGDDGSGFKVEVLRELKPDIEYSADHGGGAWFLKTKETCTKDHFCVLRKRDNETDFLVLLPEHPKLCISSGITLTKSFLAVSFLSTETGQPSLFVYPNNADTPDQTEAAKKQVLFPNVDPEATSHDAAFSETTCYDDDLVNVAVDTPVSPTIWYTYPKIGAGREDLIIIKQKEVPNYEPELYATERIYVEYEENSKDALHPSVLDEETKKATLTPANAKRPKIPVTILYKKGHLKKDGSMPLLLNGYGSYGISEEPVWSNLDTLYADLGFVVATAHIRGGGDLGEPWYQAAKFLTKKRTFFDFIAVADHLAATNWTSPGRVALCGGSAGGMLVGACLNLRPKLLKAIVAHVPFVTVLDTMLDVSLPLTPGEFKEWGNPREPAYFDYMRSYCPYENLKVDEELLASGSFPSVFATTGLSDYRVGYYEGAKWIAKMRAQIKAAKSKKEVEEPLIVMETNMAAGHAGASGRFDRLKEVSRDVAFLATEFDLIQ
eukprot:TRINITY_DN48703_c0_g1_i1.p1 TRINITY_DN48703_c0_g1~~TRINITY_DN48703_c0_g1_i1.p1  ORF type:complete len:835 (+),score=111.12 TRINITY_DN48703_c0_g1_i1:122-2506(+)